MHIGGIIIDSRLEFSVCFDFFCYGEVVGLLWGIWWHYGATMGLCGAIMGHLGAFRGRHGEFKGH